jgi:hypothetical protein
MKRRCPECGWEADLYGHPRWCPRRTPWCFRFPWAAVLGLAAIAAICVLGAWNL